MHRFIETKLIFFACFFSACGMNLDALDLTKNLPDPLSYACQAALPGEEEEYYFLGERNVRLLKLSQLVVFQEDLIYAYQLSTQRSLSVQVYGLGSWRARFDDEQRTLELEQTKGRDSDEVFYPGPSYVFDCEGEHRAPREQDSDDESGT